MKTVAFSKWYDLTKASNYKGSYKLHTKVIDSETLLIDTIFRSMQGPYSITKFKIDPLVGLLNEELLWLVGYSIDIIDENGITISDEFMCHNNLNLLGNTPWIIPTVGTDRRIFTLTEGQTNLDLPNNFGIPILNTQPLEMVAQVLNHNPQPRDIRIKHRVTIKYYRDADTDGKMEPLFQQAVFVTKQVSGPAGEYGHAPKSDSTVCNKSLENCCNNVTASKSYNPFSDSFGRSFSGHWVIDHQPETLHTEVTKMLHLTNDCNVHFISVHAHPFSERLTLTDVTDSTEIFTSNILNKKTRIGIEKIEILSDLKGIKLYKDHNYKLTSIYNNPTPTDHTAMATMFLYLSEQ